MSIEAARYRVAKGVIFLNKNVPGWFDRMRTISHFDMVTYDHCFLAKACKGKVLNGYACYSAGDVCRATGISGTAEGFYEDEKNHVTYADLHRAWIEVISNPNPPRGYRPAPLVVHVGSKSSILDQARQLLRPFRAAA